MQGGAAGDGLSGIQVSFTLIGTPVHLGVLPIEMLLETLRERLGLLGTKESCPQGECGVCTVLLDGRPVYACLLLSALALGRTVTTIEGLSPAGELHSLQRGFLSRHARSNAVIARRACCSRRVHSCRNDLTRRKPKSAWHCRGTCAGVPATDGFWRPSAAPPRTSGDVCRHEHPAD
jgi:hypothetical protein